MSIFSPNLEKKINFVFFRKVLIFPMDSWQNEKSGSFRKHYFSKKVLHCGKLKTYFFFDFFKKCIFAKIVRNRWQIRPFEKKDWKKRDFYEFYKNTEITLLLRFLVSTFSVPSWLRSVGKIFEVFEKKGHFFGHFF